MHLLIFGPPGAGKGTQAEIIAKKHNLIHLSSGELLRQEIAASRLGQEISELLKLGQLVPNELINQLLQDNLLKINLGKNNGQQGIIIDGYPRNLDQAMFLDELLSKNEEKVTAILNLELSHEEAINRILSRGTKSGRTDDNLETVTKRLKIYEAETKPVLDYYQKQGKLMNINGSFDIETVSYFISQAITSLL